MLLEFISFINEPVKNGRNINDHDEVFNQYLRLKSIEIITSVFNFARNWLIYATV